MSERGESVVTKDVTQHETINNPPFPFEGQETYPLEGTVELLPGISATCKVSVTENVVTPKIGTKPEKQREYSFLISTGSVSKDDAKRLMAACACGDDFFKREGITEDVLAQFGMRLSFSLTEKDLRGLGDFSIVGNFAFIQGKSEGKNYGVGVITAIRRTYKNLFNSFKSN